MSTRQRSSLLASVFKAPFYAGFLLLLYLLGRSCFAQINGFALSLGFSAGFVKVSGYLLYALFFFVCAIVLLKLFFRDD